MSHKKKTAIVLGGTNPHIELIRQLKERGYYTILLDYLDNPIAKPYADLHVQESSMDLDKAVKVAREYNAELVMTACVDQANITACYVAEQLGLTKPYSYETACRITDKAEMKKAMVSHGIPTTRFMMLEQDEMPETTDLRFPVMVKPTNTHGTSGVKKAYNMQQVQAYLPYARSCSRTHGALLEEYFEGTEVSAYCIVKLGKAHIIMISERLSVVEGEDQVLKCYATVTPPAISEKAKARIEKAADDIADAFGLTNTPLHVQALVNGDDIDIIEFAARVAGGLSYETIRKNLGMDMISAAIDSYLEKDIELNYHAPTKYYAVNLVYGKDGIYDHIEGVDALVADGIVENFHYYRNPGSKVSQERANSCRIAAFITSGESRKALCEKARAAFDRLKVFDVNGVDITRRDLILK